MTEALDPPARKAPTAATPIKAAKPAPATKSAKAATPTKRATPAKGSATKATITAVATGPAKTAAPAKSIATKAVKSAAPTAPGRKAGLPARSTPVGPRKRRGTAPDPATPISLEASKAELAQAKEALELAHRIVDVAADKKAADIVLLAVGALTTLTDYFVICSGGSERQLSAIADGIVDAVKADGVLPIGREGAANAHWVLVDYGSVIVHVMAWPERDFYGLEKLWSEAPLLLRLQ